MLIINFLFSNFMCMHVLQQHGLFRMRQSTKSNPLKIGAAERKILIVFCYYVLVAVISLVAFTIATRHSKPVSKQILKHFQCESNGYNPNEPCDRGVFEDITYPELYAMSYILLGVFPLVNLTYAVNFGEIRKIIKCTTVYKVDRSYR